MSSVWNALLNEFQQLHTPANLAPGGKAPWARLLWPRIQQVSAETGIPLIVYASACTAPAGKAQSALLQIDASDKIHFHSMLEALNGPKLDVIIHSPGGYAEATETIVEEIRGKFGHVRFIVPSYAKSAAAMMVMSGDEILLDEEAELGPIDPQMLTANGPVPAEAIKEQFRKASEEILQDAKKVQVWFPVLQTFGPGMLVQCDNAIALSQELVSEWLCKYMFRADSNAKAKADAVTEFLSAHSTFKSHGRRIKLKQLEPFGLTMGNLRANQNLYQKVWELYCALDIVLSNTPLFKIFYNSADVATVRQQAQAGVPGLQLRLQQPGGPAVLPAVPAPPSP